MVWYIRSKTENSRVQTPKDSIILKLTQVPRVFDQLITQTVVNICTELVRHKRDEEFANNLIVALFEDLVCWHLIIIKSGSN